MKALGYFDRAYFERRGTDLETDRWLRRQRAAKRLQHRQMLPPAPPRSELGALAQIVIGLAFSIVGWGTMMLVQHFMGWSWP